MCPIVLSSVSAIGISFIGSLPLGNLNMTAMYIAARRSVNAALLFALGAVLVEVIYLRVSLMFISWIIEHKSLFKVLQWGVVILFISLALNSFLAMDKHKKHSPVLQNTNPLLLGFILNAVNPLQIPFWAGWALYLTSTKILTEGNTYYNIFSLSAGMGTFFALFIFIVLGTKLSGYIKANTQKINLLMGVLFLLLATYQVWSLCMNV